MLAIALTAAAGGARADAHDRCGAWDWRPVSGTLSPGERCGVVVLTGDARGAGASTGRAVYDADVAGRGRHTLTIQRLTADGGSIQIEFPGGWLLLGDGKVGLYTSESQWAADGGYQPLPASLAQRRLAERTRVELQLDDADVTARVEGVLVGRWHVGHLPARGSLAVWITAPAGQRPRLRISDWALTR